ncbi:MAG TPA: GNAT family N-acetyltransferase [Stellaceae bacterium]|nr:GNAT family N-acetyltransferase [Stellaceae bacterium]
MARIDPIEESARSLPPAAPVAWLPEAVEIRPPLPADHPAYCAFAARLAREDLRLRFAGLVKLDCDALRAQLLAIDHTQHEALAVFAGSEMLAIAHLVRTAPVTAELAIIVRSDLKRRGLGRVLLARLVAHACALGLRTLTAQILSENLPMQRLAREAGFRATGRSGFLIDMAEDLPCDKRVAAPDAA